MDVELELDVAALGMGGALLPGLFDQGGVAGVLGEARQRRRAECRERGWR